MKTTMRTDTAGFETGPGEHGVREITVEQHLAILEAAVRQAWLISEGAQKWDRGTVERMREALRPGADSLRW